MRLQPRYHPTRSAAVENPIGVGISHPASATRKKSSWAAPLPRPTLAAIERGHKKQGGGCIYMYTVKPVTDYVIVCQ